MYKLILRKIKLLKYGITFQSKIKIKNKSVKYVAGKKLSID